MSSHPPLGGASEEGAEAPAAHAGMQPTGSAEGPGPSPPGVLDELLGAFASARESLAGFLELMALEARRASLSLVWMLVLGLLAGMCFIATWLGISAALAIGMISAGFAALTAVLLVALFNLVAGAIFILFCVRMSRNLMFAATRRQISGESRSEVPEP